MTHVTLKYNRYPTTYEFSLDEAGVISISDKTYTSISVLKDEYQLDDIGFSVYVNDQFIDSYRMLRSKLGDDNLVNMYELAIDLYMSPSQDKILEQIRELYDQLESDRKKECIKYFIDIL